MLGGNPQLKDAFKILLPLAIYWKTIGALLGLPWQILDAIKIEEDTINDCLLEMLSEWLKQVDLKPTWKELVDVVECIDIAKAEEIKKKTL